VGRDDISDQDGKTDSEVRAYEPSFSSRNICSSYNEICPKEEICMKKFSFGLLGLCVLVGSHFGSMMGIAIAICAFMAIDGLFEEFRKNQTRKANEKEEVKQNA